MTEASLRDGSLETREQPSFTLLNPDAQTPLLLLCDHASARIPPGLDNLGLSAGQLSAHIAVDIGAAAVTRLLAERLGASAILARWSRLVIDLNRDPEDFTSIREISDGVLVPGNRDLTPAERARRRTEIFDPYHQAVAAWIRARAAGGQAPAIVSLHSFTPELGGVARGWHAGVLTNRDRRLGRLALETLAGLDPTLVLGDNKPYSGLSDYGYSIETHALPAGLPNLLLEIRQDLITDADGQRRWAGLVEKVLARALAAPDLLTRYEI